MFNMLFGMNSLKNTIYIIFFLTWIGSLEGEKHMALPVTIDVCELNAIYNPHGYSYSLPKNVLEGFLHGKAFDHPNLYTEEELARLKTDINELFQSMVSGQPVKGNQAIISAGDLGAGKTVLLNQKLQKAAEAGFKYPYVCPDDVCLKRQTRTYVADIEAGDGSPESRKMSYDKWRPGSNVATHLLLANLIREKYSFYFGTTCSSPLTCKFFEFLKSQGYQIKVLHVSAPDKVRRDSIQERDKTFIQATEKDIKEKGQLVPQRINDTFLKYADEIEFYYRPEVSSDAVLAARWIKTSDHSKLIGKLAIIDKGAYEGVKTVHNTAIDALKKPELRWEATVEAISTIQ